jgi:transposase
MSAKRKCVVITIEQKLEAVRRIKNGEILRNVAADFGVGISTISDWVKSKSKLEEHSSKRPNRKAIKTAEHEKSE